MIHDEHRLIALLMVLAGFSFIAFGIVGVLGL